MNLLYKMIAAAGMVGAAALIRSEYERNQLVTEYYEIHSPKIKGNGKRIVFLTDLHDKEFGEENERLIQAIREIKPDAVLVGGDMMVVKGIGDLTVSLKLLRALAAEFPVYHANGNHELRLYQQRKIYGDKYLEYRKELKKAGVVYLSDSRIALDEDIELYGLNLKKEYYHPGYPKMEVGYMKCALGNASLDKFTILLAHSPMFFQEYAEWGADLTLSGHFHGGTIRLPFVGGVMTPQYQFFFPWCAGQFHAENGKSMIVGRGLGTHSINVRLNDKPQVIVVNIKK